MTSGKLREYANLASFVSPAIHPVTAKIFPRSLDRRHSVANHLEPHSPVNSLSLGLHVVYAKSSTHSSRYGGPGRHELGGVKSRIPGRPKLTHQKVDGTGILEKHDPAATSRIHHGRDVCIEAALHEIASSASLARAWRYASLAKCGSGLRNL